MSDRRTQNSRLSNCQLTRLWHSRDRTDTYFKKECSTSSKAGRCKPSSVLPVLVACLSLCTSRWQHHWITPAIMLITIHQSFMKLCKNVEIPRLGSELGKFIWNESELSLYHFCPTFIRLPFSCLLFHEGQAAIKLPSAEASKWAQCTSPGQYTPYIKEIMKTQR